ncbi:MAG: hypothetical protein V1789_12840 [PVC group bacterium]
MEISVFFGELIELLQRDQKNITEATRICIEFNPDLKEEKIECLRELEKAEEKFKKEDEGKAPLKTETEPKPPFAALDMKGGFRE